MLRQFTATAEKTVSAAAAATITMQSAGCLYGETIGRATRLEKTVVIMILTNNDDDVSKRVSRLGSVPIGGRLCVGQHGCTIAR